METWAHCASCRRWYYCAAQASGEAEATSCPVCCAEPEMVEQRPAVEYDDISVTVHAGLDVAASAPAPA